MTTSESEGFESRLREVLHSRDSLPVGFTAGRVVAGGRRRRRSRAMASSGAALAAVVGLAVGSSTILAGGPDRGGYQPGVSPIATSSLTTPPAPASSATPGRAQADAPAKTPVGTPVTTPISTMRVVAPGTVDIGSGAKLALTTDSVTLLDPGGSVGPDYTDTGNQASESLNLMSSGPALASIYVGTHIVASATVTVAGEVYPSTTLTLAGHPGWCVTYAVLPPGTEASAAVVAVFDASGRQLASTLPLSATGQP